jgi:predicted ATPase
MRKIVLTGGPSCGKTTLINKLESEGFNVMHEVARKVLEKNGSPKNEVEVFRLQHDVYLGQLFAEREIEEKFPSGALVFLDRGVPDVFAYSNYYNVKANFPDYHDFVKHPYSAVFQLDRFPFENDGLRVENSDEEAAEIHACVEKTYQQLEGINPHRVSCYNEFKEEESVVARMNYILNEVNVYGR